MFNSQPQENKIEQAENKEDIFQKILSESDSVEINLATNRNEKGELLAHNGNISHLQNELFWKIVRTPSFKEWFANSVVKDENGEPKVVYRSSLLKNFDISNSFKPHAQSWQGDHFGTFFTSDRKNSVRWFETHYNDNTEHKKYSHESEDKFLINKEEFLKHSEKQVKVFTAFIKLENPYIEKGYFAGRLNEAVVSIGDFTNRFTEGKEQFLEELRNNHDGLYLPSSSDYGDEYAVLKTENIFILPSDISSNDEVDKAEKKEKFIVANQNKEEKPAMKPKKSFLSRILGRPSFH